MAKESFEVYDICIFCGDVETTGYRGGDAGHGGFARFRMYMDGGGCLEATTEDLGHGDTAVEVTVRGDAEIRTFIEGLREAARRLERMARDESPGGHKKRMTLEEAQEEGKC